MLQHRVFGGVGFLPVVRRTDDIGDRYIIMLCKFMIAFIAAGNSHDRTGAITSQHVFRDPDGYLASIKGIQRISAGKNAADLFLGHPLAFTSAFYIRQVFFHCFLLRSASDTFHQCMFRCNHHKIHTENSVRTGRVHPERGSRSQILPAGAGT